MSKQRTQYQGILRKPSAIPRKIGDGATMIARWLK